LSSCSVSRSDVEPSESVASLIGVSLLVVDLPSPTWKSNVQRFYPSKWTILALILSILLLAIVVVVLFIFIRSRMKNNVDPPVVKARTNRSVRRLVSIVSLVMRLTDETTPIDFAFVVLDRRPRATTS
jgi:glucan phosphoethanolaminetransferase (alkaline phosphatase superfamily)